MAETGDNGGAPAPDAGDGGEGQGEGAAAAGAGGDGGGKEAPQRPDHIPEKFWDPEKGQPKVEDLAKGYTELAQRQAKGKEGLREQVEADIRAELEGKVRPDVEKAVRAEIMKAAPKTPMDYSVEIDPESDVGKTLDEAGVVILTEEPGDDFVAEDGKFYFTADPSHPLQKFFRSFAHKHGLSNEAFQEAMAGYVQAEMEMQPTDEARAAHRQQVYEALGDHGEDRYNFVMGRLDGLLGEDGRRELIPQGTSPNAKVVKQLETLLAKAGEPRFDPDLHKVAGKDAGALRDEARQLMSEPDYWNDPAKQARAAEIFRRISAIEKGPKAA